MLKVKSIDICGAVQAPIWGLCSSTTIVLDIQNCFLWMVSTFWTVRAHLLGSLALHREPFPRTNPDIWFWDNQWVACFQFVGHEIARESSLWVEQCFSIFSDMHGAAGDGWRTPGLRVEHSRMSLSTMKTAYWLTGRHTRGPSFWWFWVVAVRLYEYPNVTKMFSFIKNQCRVE